MRQKEHETNTNTENSRKEDSAACFEMREDHREWNGEPDSEIKSIQAISVFDVGVDSSMLQQKLQTSDVGELAQDVGDCLATGIAGIQVDPQLEQEFQNKSRASMGCEVGSCILLFVHCVHIGPMFDQVAHSSQHPSATRKVQRSLLLPRPQIHCGPFRHDDIQNFTTPSNCRQMQNADDVCVVLKFKSKFKVIGRKQLIVLNMLSDGCR